MTSHIPGHRARKAVRKQFVACGVALAMTAAFLLGVGVSAASATSPNAPECAPFPDVTSSNTHCDNIAWLKKQQITKPKDQHYRPAAPVSRGAMAAFLFRLTHPNEPAPVCASDRFRDVDDGNIFCGYITWVADHHIAYGYKDGSYGSARPVTRGAMAAFLYRIVNTDTAAPGCAEAPFSDVQPDEMFCGVITWMKTARITYGIDDGVSYGTTNPVTRQAMASFLRRLDDLLTYGAPPVCSPTVAASGSPTGANPASTNPASTDPANAAPPTASRTQLGRYPAMGAVTARTALIANTIGPEFGITTIYGWRPSASEQYDPNGHPAGLALDFMINNVPDGEEVGTELAAYLQRNHAWINIEYIIYQQHIWLAGWPYDRWREMEDRGSPTQNHMDHVHLSLRTGDAAGC